MRMIDPAPTTAEVHADLRIVRDEYNGEPRAKVWRGNAQRPTWSYRFRSSQQREQWLAERMTEAAQRVADKAALLAEQRAARAAFHAADHVKVGDLFCHSWGYDQTNTEFFQVVEVLEKKVRVRQIAAEHVPGSAGFMCEDLCPVPGKFMEKTYNFTGGHSYAVDGALLVSLHVCGGSVGLTCQHGCCSKIEPGSKHYHSWYA